MVIDTSVALQIGGAALFVWALVNMARWIWLYGLLPVFRTRG